MTVRRKVWLTFGIILLLAIGAGLVDWPKGPNIRIGSYFKELKVHLGLDLSGGAQLVYEADVSKIAQADRASALAGTRDVIERRVNTFGVSEPVVQTSTAGGASRVIVELPGVTDVNDAITRIGETPLLEFREQPAATEQAPLTDDEKKLIADTNTQAEATAKTVLAKVKAGEDFANLADQYSEDPGNTGTDGEKKGGDLGFQDPNNYVPAFRDALLALKDGEYTQNLVQSDFGYHLIKRITSRQGKDTNGSAITEIDARHILLKTMSEADLRPQTQSDYVNTGLSGQHLKSASVTFDPNTGEPEVSLTFNDEGKKLFGDITKRNVGKPVAIYLDGQPISIPTVQQAITTGQAVITGKFTLQEAKQLAARLTAGALPVPITLISQERVGASLGKESIERSFAAGLLGLALVVVFMVLYYRLPGLLSVFALGIYSLLVLAIFKLWPVTLTLAGIAGFILSIGMAVDANVLIFERMKEELREGKPLDLAIEQGFARAWLSIRDSNVSSIITCLILAWFGTSLVQGFAITLVIGILISMFSAITVTRTFLRLIAGRWLQKHTGFLGVKQLDQEKP
ncbi:MAG: protein translocase subunit SecD [bacterium]